MAAAQCATTCCPLTICSPMARKIRSGGNKHLMPWRGVSPPRQYSVFRPTERRPHATNRISAVGQVDVPLARHGAAVRRRLCTTKDRAHHPEKRYCAPCQLRGKSTRHGRRNDHHHRVKRTLLYKFCCI